MLACGVAGCGSSGGDTVSAPLPKPQYVKQAEAICTKATEETRKAAAAWKKGFAGGAAEAEEHADDGLRKVLIPALEHEAEQLEALEPPAKDKAVVARFVANLSQAGAVLKEEGFDALPESGAIEFKTEAVAYGLKSCGGAL
jgi:hypothetical protein